MTAFLDVPMTAFLDVSRRNDLTEIPMQVYLSYPGGPTGRMSLNALIDANFETPEQAINNLRGLVEELSTALKRARKADEQPQ
jgi:hypothetical protein